MHACSFGARGLPMVCTYLSTQASFPLITARALLSVLLVLMLILSLGNRFGSPGSYFVSNHLAMRCHTARSPCRVGKGSWAGLMGLCSHASNMIMRVSFSGCLRRPSWAAGGLAGTRGWGLTARCGVEWAPTQDTMVNGKSTCVYRDSRAMA
jgi:hypothetical protein